MAVFLFDISVKSESRVFSDRFRNDSFEEETIDGDPDFNYDSIDVDPCKDSCWSGFKLTSWGKQVTKQYEECISNIHKKVLDQVHKDRIEPWMTPMIDYHRTNSNECIVLTKLIDMITRAEKNKGTIVFIGD